MALLVRIQDTLESSKNRRLEQYGGVFAIERYPVQQFLGAVICVGAVLFELREQQATGLSYFRFRESETN